jgi:hypothetical protein
MTVAYFSSFQRKHSPFGFIQKVSPPTIPPFCAGFCPFPDFPLIQLFKKRLWLNLWKSFHGSGLLYVHTVFLKGNPVKAFSGVACLGLFRIY